MCFFIFTQTWSSQEEEYLQELRQREPSKTWEECALDVNQLFSNDRNGNCKNLFYMYYHTVKDLHQPIMKHKQPIMKRERCDICY